MSTLTMFNTKPNNFYTVLNPMFYVGKIFALAPFRLSDEGYEKSRLNIFLSIIFATFLYIFSLIVVNNRPPLKAGNISRATEMLDSYLSQIIMCSGILFECIYSNQVLNAIQEINSFDKYFQYSLHIDLNKEYKKSRKYIILTLLITGIFLGITVAFTIKSTIRHFTFESFGELLVYVAPLLISSLVDFQFCAIIFCLKQRFRWLNSIIQEVSKNFECDINVFSIAVHGSVRPTTQIVTAGFMQDRALYTFEKIRVKHHQLCSVAQTINKAFSVQLLFMVLQNFVTTILALFYCGKQIIVYQFITTEYVLYSVNQVLVAVIQVVAMVITCSTTVSEAQKTGYLTHSAIMKQNQCKEELELEVSFFSLQLFHQNLEFKACRIFVINESLLLSIIGSITTYLVIVVQFELEQFFE